MTDFETHPAGTADLKARVNDALVGVTPGPWSLCAHLHRDEVDEGCSCGYRGVVFGPEDRGMAVCQPGHDPAPAGEEGTEPQRYDRATERQNARFIAAARDLVPELMTHIEQLAAALTRANAATAAAYEVAAREVECGCGAGPCQDTANCAAEDAAAIRALATPDQTAALDRLIAEAEARVLDAASAYVQRVYGSEWTFLSNPVDRECILAASKKGGA